MKILLTGHKGYLGGEFLKRYGSEYEIVGYDIAEGDDLLEYENLLQKSKGCEQMVHLAAIPAPKEGKSFENYFDTNCRGTFNIAKAAVDNGVKRIVYGSSTTMYGIEKGIPFHIPILENQPLVSQYIDADTLSCRDVDLAYHSSKAIAEQILAWHGLMKKVQVVSLRFGPINKVFLGTSVSINNATQAIKLAIDSTKELWFEPFSIVDEIDHVDISKAKSMLGYNPEKPNYAPEVIRWRIEDRAV